VTARGNTVSGMPFGIKLRNGSNNLIESNRIWMPTKAALYAVNDQTDRDYLTGNVFRTNQIVPVKSGVNQFPALPSFSESF
ncbi:right-handed parallel beta-helix repeat-containing protein, partial [Streptococcus pyogenes]